jgi:glutathione S-transferase
MVEHPDSKLHPRATGPAAKIVAAHQEPAPLTLYSGWFCPFVQRVWAVLEEKQIPYQYVEVNPYNKPDSLMRINPRGLVPTLEFEGKPLYESSVVLEFLEDVWPESGNKLRSEDHYLRAKGRIWADFVSSALDPLTRLY